MMTVSPSLFYIVFFPSRGQKTMIAQEGTGKENCVEGEGRRNGHQGEEKSGREEEKKGQNCVEFFLFRFLKSVWYALKSFRFFLTA